MSNRRKHTASEWKQILAEYERCGESARVFCQRHALGESTFWRWNKRLREAEPSAGSLPVPAFIEVRPPPRVDRALTLRVGDGLSIDCPVLLGMAAIAELARAICDGR